MKRPLLSFAALLGLGFLAACGAKEAGRAALPTFEPQSGWIQECIGRYLVEVPAPINLGAARVVHQGPDGRENDHGSGIKFKIDPLGGDVQVAGLTLLETTRLAEESEFRKVWGWADRAYRIDVIRDGGPVEERAERAKAVQKYQLPNDAYIWRNQNKLDLGILAKTDMRARMLFGELSGEGSLKQARAVVDQLWPRFQTRTPGQWPQQAGLCTPYGFFADPADLTERDHRISLAFRHPQHPGLILRVSFATNNVKTLGVMHSPLPIDQRPTPWEEEARWAKERRDECRSQQGTASRDLIGCAFAGARDIRRWREVQFLKLPDGQLARLLAYENNTGLLGNQTYTVKIQSAGETDSAAAPQISISVTAHVPEGEQAEAANQQLPSLDEAISIAKKLAASVRRRPGAIREGVPVADSLEGVR